MTIERPPSRRSLSPDLRLGDLKTFLSVHRFGSVSGAARAHGTVPSVVSKAVSRLERQLHVVLLNRSTRGVALTEAALRLLPRLEQAVTNLEEMTSPREARARTLTFAGSSWLVELFLPAAATAVPGLRFCALELPPAMLRAHAAENHFDLCLVVGRADLPPTWHGTTIDDVRLGLFARPQLLEQLGRTPVTVERLATVPFIAPVYSVNGRVVQADDDCPLPFSARRPGHQAHTLRVALSIAAENDQLVFGPAMAAQREVAAGRLVEVAVDGWNQRAPLVVICNPARLRKHEHDTIVETVRSRLRAP